MLQTANKKIENPKSAYAWLTSEEENIEAENQKFLFTVTGLRDIMKLIKRANNISNIEKIPKVLPMYFFAGTNDPIGEYGEGVKRAVKLYNKVGIVNISLKLYEGNRHECLNEKNKDEVIKDMIDWILVNNKD